MNRNQARLSRELATRSTEVTIPIGAVRLCGELRMPSAASGVVVFAHGSGSSRHSPRNRFVAEALQQSGLAVLLMDLLEEDEGEDRDKVFDIELLAARLLGAAQWLAAQPETRSLRIGYFGASTGAAAALVAAATQPERVAAVVSRGGRVDMAGAWLSSVQAPTLFIVGELDSPVLEWNEEAFARLTVEKDLVVVPGATHLFEEPGTLDTVAQHASRWFVLHLSPDRNG
jgi:putative phosphoribosyl transferase